MDDEIEVVWAVVDDYEAVYIDGTLVDSDNSINWPRLFVEHLVGKSVYSFATLHADTEWVQDRGEFPRTLEELEEHD